MSDQILEIARRIRELREIMGISVGEMAERLGMAAEEYTPHETGEEDFSFTFLYKCAGIFGIDIVELLTGENPKLSFYTIVRGSKGLPMKRRAGFTYNHLAYRFKNKLAEPFLVRAPYSEEEQDRPIHLSFHRGQEFDFVLQGSLKVAMEDHIEYLNEGDAIYYDSGHGHGMIATGGGECVFLAVVIAGTEEETDE